MLQQQDLQPLSIRSLHFPALWLQHTGYSVPLYLSWRLYLLRVLMRLYLFPVIIMPWRLYLCTVLYSAVEVIPLSAHPF